MFSIKRIIRGLFRKEREPAFNMREVAAKIVLFIAVIICIGLPITNVFGFAILFISGLLIANGKIKLSAKRFAAICAVVLIVVLIKSVLPRAALEEGHNIVVINRDGEALERGLPPDVFAYMKKLFLKRYPLEERREPTDESGHWLRQPLPESVFTFSTDSALSRPKYTRIVDYINFSNLVEFRGGFANEVKYNWYGHSDIQRESMPFFVMYELSEASVNSSLCWRGHMLWENSSGRFDPLYHAKMSGRKITPEDVGRRIFGLSINNKLQVGFWDTFRIWISKWQQFFYPGKHVEIDNNNEQLAIRLQLSPILRASAVVKCLLIIFGVFSIIWLTVKIRWKALVLPVLFISIAAAVVVCYCPHLFGGYFIHEGGEDGATYQTYGRNILRYALAGNWKMALRGEEDVYYYTPGFRYFRAIEKFIFGDTNFGNLIVLLLLPYVFWKFLLCFIPKTWSFWMTIVFLLGIFPYVFLGHIDLFYYYGMLLQNLGFSYHLYVMTTRGGWPETIGCTAFFAAIWLALKYYPVRGKTFLWYGFIAHFLLFITVFVRPQYSVACLIVMLYLAIRLIKERRFREMVFIWMGFAPVLCIPLHNYWFGKKFLLFTSSLPVAIKTPPMVYLQAFKEAVFFNFSGDNLKNVIVQIKMMIGPWYRLLLLLSVLFVSFIRRNIPSNLRLLAGVALSFHAVNLFVACVIWRHVFLAWLLTTTAVMASLIWWLGIDSRRAPGADKTAEIIL